MVRSALSSHGVLMPFADSSVPQHISIIALKIPGSSSLGTGADAKFN